MAGDQHRSVTTDIRPIPQAESRRRALRHGIGYLTILCTLPYLLIKVVWVSGSTVGLAEPDAVDSGVLLAGNALTLAMDGIAVLVVLVLTRSWGERVTPWLVLVPAWVGLGFLVPIAVTFPLETIAHLSSGAPDRLAGPQFLEPWVRPVVYASFTAQGVGIAAAFTLYVRARWSHLLLAARRSRQDPHEVVGRLGLAAAIALTAPAAGTRLLWSADFPVGLPALLPDDPGLSHHLRSGLSGLLAIGALVGLAVLVLGRSPGRSLWLPLSAAWVGSGATWAWAAYGLVAQSALTPGSDLGILPWIHASEVLGASVLALVTMEHLREGRCPVDREAFGPTVDPRTEVGSNVAVMSEENSTGHGPRVSQLRVIVEVEDHEAAVRFFRDILGLEEQVAFEGEGDARVAILHAGHATLELANPAQKRLIDEVETGSPGSPRFRLAFEVDDTRAATERLVATGAPLLGPPTVTPWRSLNARLEGPGGVQLTLFQELTPLAERQASGEFATDQNRRVAGREE